jgi:hypothetical protein
MQSMSYLLVVLVLTLFGAIVGLVAHFIRASFDQGADQAYENPYVAVARPETAVTHYFEKSIVGAEWMENGCWDPDSYRNMAYMMALGAMGPFVVGMAGWPSRYALMAKGCATVIQFGLKPVFCS